jgi:hypothetical protein
VPELLLLCAAPLCQVPDGAAAAAKKVYQAVKEEQYSAALLALATCTSPWKAYWVHAKTVLAWRKEALKRAAAAAAAAGNNLSVQEAMDVAVCGPLPHITYTTSGPCLPAADKWPCDQLKVREAIWLHRCSKHATPASERAFISRAGCRLGWLQCLLFTPCWILAAFYMCPAGVHGPGCC